ncbi:MAG: tetratricopeptide repeat protein [Chloroflexota bacterium]|nr:tetratricopeptide repeat protein [Chloroflexota bacterium]MDQ5865649.1 tetratricopeptide repeat protein [Chloroflexota bacterium]
MADFSYLNFDVQIQRADGGYRLVVEAPSGETIRAPFEPPFSELELENFMLKAGPTRRGVRRADTSEVDAAKRFGEKLYAALFTADVRSALQSSLDQARQRGESGQDRVGVRLRLRLVDVPELAGVPWEYIYNPALNRFLALSTETPLVRYLDMPERIRPLQVAQPLRVLVMLPSPSDYPELDVRQEWLNLNTTLADLQQAGLVELELLETSTLTGLQRQLRRNNYHIFHFIGHGAFDRNAADGLLILEDEDGRGRPVSGQDMALLLHDHASLRLAVLNACEGALSALDDPFAGVAQSLVQGGLPAVIAMQFEITDRAAIVFAHEFYRAMSDGYPVDAALTEARKVMLTESRGSGLEWGTPVLYMRSPDGRIFNLEKTQQPAPAPGSTPDGSQAEAPRRREEPVSPVRKQEPVEAVPPAPRPHAEVRSAAALSDSTAAAAKAEEPSPMRGTETPTRKRDTRLLPVVLAIVVVVIAAAGVLFFSMPRAGNTTPTSQGQVPAEALAHNDNGLLARDSGDLDKAIAEFSEAIRLKPDYAAAYLNRGAVYRSQEKYAESLADFSRAIELVPGNGASYLERGTTYMYANNNDSAISDFTRVIELVPNSSEAYYYRGLIYLNLSEYDKAIDDFSKVLELQPTWQDAYGSRGKAYAGKSEYESAIEDYTQAIELAPDQAVSFYFDRAEVYRLQGDNAKAIADYRTVVEQSDDDWLSTEATQRLKLLENK